MDIDMILEVRDAGLRDFVLREVPDPEKVGRLNRKESDIWMFHVELSDPEKLRGLLGKIEKHIEDNGSWFRIVAIGNMAKHYPNPEKHSEDWKEFEATANRIFEKSRNALLENK